MASYKEASERMNRTGNGLEGFQYTSFQEYIVKNVCRYYFELEPILKDDRPNVTPWYTNEDDSDEIEEDEEETENNNRNSTVFLSSDDDSASSLTNCSIKTRDIESNEETSEHGTIQTTKTSRLRERIMAKYDDEYSSDSDHTLSTTNNTSHVSNMSDDNSSSNLGSPKLKKKDKMTKSPKRKNTKSQKSTYTPVQVKKMQKTLLAKNKKKKSIVKKNGGSSSTSNVSLDHDERDLLIETRNSKMTFEKEKHMDMKRFENEKMNIERERLRMEKDTILLKHKHMMTQDNLERVKLHY